jgi:N-acetyl-1-D-myo-inositol-2-amino-2-deoxy-alpha-D-glucopyranoside deacetylase
MATPHPTPPAADDLGSGLLAVHAHPDDEVIGTGGVLARAAAEGRRTMVVTCTDGRRGEVVGEGMDPAEVLPRLPEVRAAELAAALDLLGVAEHAFLGYHDSGMAAEAADGGVLVGAEGAADPATFWRADVHEATGRLVAIIRRFRPSVVVTYDAFGGYGHPDHVQAHRVTLLAVEAAAMPVLYPEAGPAWQTPKLYLATFPKSAIATANAAFLDAGLPSPFGESADPGEIPMGVPDEAITTVVDVRAHLDAKQRALLAHASQIAPDSFFMNVPEAITEAFYGTEWFVRRHSAVPVPAGSETDLFAGL